MPYDCDLDSSIGHFLEKLGDRKLLFVGDSTMRQSYAVLAATVGVAQGRIIYRESDTLVGRSFGGYNRGRPWDVLVREEKPDIVVMSVGPHIRGDAASYQALLEEIKASIDALGSEGGAMSKIKIFWKTSNVS